LAAAIGQQKAEHISDSGAEAVVTGNPGCIMQIRAHLAMRGDAKSETPVLHPVELLLPAAKKQAGLR
jgi:glycolate oxidase iron-sulfur subunit